MDPNPAPASMNKKWIIGIVIVVVLILIVWMAMSGGNQTAPSASQTYAPTATTNQTTPANQQPTPAPAGQILTVTYTGGGFSPNPVTIKAGYTVKFVNESDGMMWVASNPHPTHTDYPGFDEKTAVPNGGSYSFTFFNVGTWGYHNHVAPTVMGTVIVQPD